MAREKVGSDVMQVRFPDGTFARMDERFGKGGRAEFIRDAVLRTLNGLDGDVLTVGPKPAVREERAKRPERRVLPKGAKLGRWDEQKPVLLAKVRERSMDERTAARELGWAEGLVSRVAAELSEVGYIRYERGLMVHVDGG